MGTVCTVLNNCVYVGSNKNEYCINICHAYCYGKKLDTKRDRATERTRQERSKRRARAGDEGERNYKQKSDAK